MTAAIKTVSLTMAMEFVAETEGFARANQQPLSEYIREAVREKNERQLAERIKFLAKKLSAEADALDQDFDATLGDGLGKN
ncbi:antitoxin of toxin-antitoxin stability system [Oxalobacteraceae bacterium A2-2]